MLRADHEMLLALDQEDGEAIGRYFGDSDHDSFQSASAGESGRFFFSEIFQHAISSTTNSVSQQLRGIDDPPICASAHGINDEAGGDPQVAGDRREGHENPVGPDQ